MESIEIRELDPDIIKPSMRDVRDPDYTRGGSKIVIIGKPGTGKTWCIKSLLYDKRMCFPSCLVMSGTEDSNKSYEENIPATFIYDRLKPDVLENYIKRQKVAKKYLPNPWSVLLLDDCTDDPKIFNTPLFQGLYKNGRHWNMFFILSLQYCMDIKPVMRTNIDGSFILRETNLRNRKALYENYAGIIPTFKLFCDLMDCLTSDYTALYIHNQSTSNDWRECVFWYQPHAVPDNWKFGSEDFWNFHEQRYDNR